MGDTVKITVIATGFQPEDSPKPERRTQVVPVIRAHPEPLRPEPVPEAVPEPAPAFASEPEPEPEAEPALTAEAEPMLDMDDLDTPAYLRQGRLLN